MCFIYRYNHFFIILKNYSGHSFKRKLFYYDKNGKKQEINEKARNKFLEGNKSFAEELGLNLSDNSKKNYVNCSNFKNLGSNNLKKHEEYFYILKMNLLEGTNFHEKTFGFVKNAKEEEKKEKKEKKIK